METEPTPHPVLDQPWTYRLVAMRCEFPPNAFDDSYLELDLLRDGRIRTLRFSKPTQLRIEPRFPDTSGLVINDIRERGLEICRVEVTSFEQDGALWFYAAAVKDVTLSRPI